MHVSFSGTVLALLLFCFTYHLDGLVIPDSRIYTRFTTYSSSDALNQISQREALISTVPRSLIGTGSRTSSSSGGRGLLGHLGLRPKNKPKAPKDGDPTAPSGPKAPSEPHIGTAAVSKDTPTKYPWKDPKDGTVVDYRKVKKKYWSAYLSAKVEKGQKILDKLVADVIAGTPQDAGKTKARMDNFQEYYYEATEVRETDVKISSQWGKVNKMFKQAGISDVDASKGFTVRTWYSKVPKKVEGNVKGFELEGDHHPVMIAAYNKESGIMINYWALAAADGNIKAHKAHASDMSAGAQKAMQGTDGKAMMYQDSLNIVNPDALNTMALMHLDDPGSVSHILTRPDGSQLSPVTGMGTWRRGKSKHFATYFASELGQVGAKFVSDHHTTVDNPMPEVLWKFPEIDKSDLCDGLRKGASLKNERWGATIWKFGPRPKA